MKKHSFIKLSLFFISLVTIFICAQMDIKANASDLKDNDKQVQIASNDGSQSKNQSDDKKQVQQASNDDSQLKKQSDDNKQVQQTPDSKQNEDNLVKKDNYNSSIVDLNQYQTANNNNSIPWDKKYGSVTRSSYGLAHNAGIMNLNDFTYAISYAGGKLNSLSDEQDWQKKIDPLGAYYAPLLDKYIKKGYYIKIPSDNLKSVEETFTNYIKDKHLSSDYINYEKFKDSKFSSSAILELSITHYLNHPSVQSEDGNANVNNNVDHSKDTYKPTDRLSFNSINIQNSFGPFSYLNFSTTVDNHMLNINGQSLKDYSGIYNAPIYMVTLKDVDNPSAIGIYRDNKGVQKSASVAIPLDYLLFLSPQVYDSKNNLVSNDINDYQETINYVYNSEIIKTQNISKPYNTTIVLNENELDIPKGYKLGPLPDLTIQTLDSSSDFYITVQKDEPVYTDDNKNDKSNAIPGSDNSSKLPPNGTDSKKDEIRSKESEVLNDHVHQLEEMFKPLIDVGKPIVDTVNKVVIEPAKKVIDVIKTTTKEFVNYAKKLYNESKDTLTLGIQSLINSFFNRSGNFNKTLLTQGQFKALSGALNMINKISNFKSHMVKGIVHGGISSAIKQSFKDFKTGIISKIKTLKSFNLHSIVDKARAVKDIPKEFIGNVKALSRHVRNSVSSAKLVMQNELDFINSTMKSVSDNQYVIGKLRAIKNSLDSQMKYFNEYEYKDTVRTYDEAKKAYSKYQKINGIVNNVSNSFNSIREALNPKTNQVVKWIKQYTNTNMAFGFTRNRGLLTLVTPWGDFKYDYHYRKEKQILYNRFIISKNAIKTIVSTGLNTAGDLLENAADKMLAVFPEGLIGTALIYLFVEGSKALKLQNMAGNFVANAIYDNVSGRDYKDDDIAKHINPLSILNF